MVSLDATLWGENDSSDMPLTSCYYILSPRLFYMTTMVSQQAQKRIWPILEEKLGLEKDSIEVIKSFAKQMESRSFIAHWKMPEPAIKGGHRFLLLIAVKE